MTAARSISQLATLLQSGALDPVALAEETLARIDAHPDKAVFIELSPERAMADARAASERIRSGRSRGLLDGIPIAWKDLFDVAGMVTRAGSAVFAGNPPAVEDADVVAAVAAAGMVSVGRTNLNEFAFSGLGLNPHYGTPVNPCSTDGHRLPGGSSSGSGVAVAAGLVPVAMGTDTGGSIRIPAAFNGIVGYKATRGRYSMRGVYPLAKSLDSLGPLCHTVQDAVRIDAAMRGLPAPDIKRGIVAGLKLLVPRTVVFDGAEPGVVAAVEAAIERLVEAGAIVRRTEMPIFAEIFDMMAKRGALVTAEAFALHRERLAGDEAERMDHRVVARARLGEKISLVDYVETLNTRERMIAEMARIVEPGEIITFPTVPHVAPKVAPLLESDEAFFAMNGKTLRNTLIGNFLDWCGVSIPCGTGDAGMPVGLLLSGLPHTDEHLLGVALAAEGIVRG